MGEETQLPQQENITSAIPALDLTKLWHHQSFISCGFLFGPAPAPGTWHGILLPDTSYSPSLEKASSGFVESSLNFSPVCLVACGSPPPVVDLQRLRAPPEKCTYRLSVDISPPNLSCFLRVHLAAFSEGDIAINLWSSLFLWSHSGSPYPVMIKWS